MTIALNLPIKRKWFELIQTGEKREEYRSCRNRQVMRLYDALLHKSEHLSKHANIAAVFRNGYHLGSAAVAVEIAWIALRSGDKAQHPEWGEPTDKKPHMVIRLGKVLTSGAYCTVRDMLKERGAE